MDRRERTNDPLSPFQAALKGLQSRMWTALPCIVVDYSAAKMTCTLQPAVQGQTQDVDQNWKNVNLPVLQDVPVQFPSGGNFVMSFPITAGDEGVAIFSSRCIDSWWSSGGVQPQAEYRMHHLSDAMFVPGIFSQARKVANINTTDVQLRTKDGMTKISISADGHVTLSAAGGALSMDLDPGTGRANIVAVGGFWVNGVRVIVP